MFEGCEVSVNYAKIRVSPPLELIKKIFEYLSNDAKAAEKWHTAVDVGCGTGQATRLLAPNFERVIGLDISETQIKEAMNSNTCANVEYKVSSAESLPISDNSVNLVVASEAFHYFDAPVFYKEVNRCLKSNGVLAVFGYKLPDVFPCYDLKNEKFKSLIYDTYKDELLASFVDSRAKLIVEQGYNSVVLPFNDFTRIIDDFSTVVPVNIADILQLVSSWSGFNMCSQKEPEKAKKLLENVKNKIKILAEENYSQTMKFHLVYNFVLLMSRKL